MRYIVIATISLGGTLAAQPALTASLLDFGQPGIIQQGGFCAQETGAGAFRTVAESETKGVRPGGEKYSAAAKEASIFPAAETWLLMLAGLATLRYVLRSRRRRGAIHFT